MVFQKKIFVGLERSASERNVTRDPFSFRSVIQRQKIQRASSWNTIIDRSIDRSVIGERISRRSGSRGSAFKTSFFHVLVHAGLHAIGQQHVARDFIAAEHESVSHCVRVCVCRRGKETRRLRKTLKSLERVITGIRSVCHDNGIQCAPAYTCNTSRHPFALLRLVAGSSLHMYGSRETGACDEPAENPTYPKFRDLFYRYSRNLKHPKTVGASRSIQTPSLDSTTQLQL